MGLPPFLSQNRYVRCLPLLFSAQIFLFFLCTGPVSAETDGVGLSGTSAAYTIGDTITFQGETNHAPGTTLLISVEEMAFLPLDKGEEGGFSGTSGTVVDQAGPFPFWSFSFSTAGWSPGMYHFIVEVPKTGTMQSGAFSLIPAGAIADAPDLNSSAPPPSDTPQQPLPSPVTTPSPTAVPLSPAVCVVGLAAVFLFRAYFV